MNITIEKTVTKPCNQTIKWRLVWYLRCQLLTWQGGNKRKRRWSGVGWGGVIIWRRRLFKYFCQRGAITQGRWFFTGQLLFEEIWIHCMNGSCLGDKAANMTKQEKKLISQHNKHSKFQPQQHLANEPQVFFIHSLVALFQSVLLCNNNNQWWQW